MSYVCKTETTCGYDVPLSEIHWKSIYENLLIKNLIKIY